MTNRRRVFPFCCLLVGPTLALLFGLAISPCSQAIADPLPFYDEGTLTPKWPTKACVATDSHRIASFEFTDQAGASVTNESLSGKIYLANFFFTSCPGICSSMTENLKIVQTAFASDESLKIVSHSVTPEFDSQERLKKYEAKYGIDGSQWHLVTGEKSSIYRLARKSYFADEEIGYDESKDAFLHTEKVLLIDAQGRIRGVYNGVMRVDMKRIIEDVNTLKSENSLTCRSL